VRQGALKKSDIWTQSRQSLEEAIEEEKENTEHNWDSDLLSHEQRLDQRLDKLKLDMFIMGSDGACQVCHLPHRLLKPVLLSVLAFCTCILYLLSVAAVCSCFLPLYFVAAFCSCIL